MYAKLFDTITDSTLMQESVSVRYVFMALLSLADPDGVVDGTGFTLAKRLCVEEEEFNYAIERLTAADPESNFPDEDGRRLVPSDRGRGWRITTYKHYDQIKTQAHKRQYMRDYMRDYRLRQKESKVFVKDDFTEVYPTAKATAESATPNETKSAPATSDPTPTESAQQSDANAHELHLLSNETPF